MFELILTTFCMLIKDVIHASKCIVLAQTCVSCHSPCGKKTSKKSHLHVFNKGLLFYLVLTWSDPNVQKPLLSQDLLKVMTNLKFSVKALCLEQLSQAINLLLKVTNKSQYFRRFHCTRFHS